MEPQQGPLPVPAWRASLVLVPIALAVVAMVLSWALGGWSGGFWDVAWTAAATSAVAGTLLARERAAAADRRRWTLWAGASAAWLVGQLVWNLYGVIGFSESPNPADVAWWAFAWLNVVSLGTRTGSRAARAVARLEAMPVIAAAVALSIAKLWPAAAASALPMTGRLSALAYPVFYIAAAILMLQETIAGRLRWRSPSLRLVLLGMAAVVIAFGLWSTQLLAGTYTPGASALDPLWVVGLSAIGVGGLFAARRPEPVLTTGEPADRGGTLPALLFVALIVVLIQLRMTASDTGPRVILELGLLFCGASLIVRGRLLSRRLRALLGRERSALAALEQREAELARLNAELVEDSRHDPLTGMRNRRALADDLLGLEAARRERDRSYALALCDIDHFKVYNDLLGHLAGDQALREVAAIVRGTLRGGDLAYRFGGEELLILLPDVSAADALEVVERVRRGLQRAALPHPGGIDGVLTLSIGVATGQEEPGAMMARADAALYEAKRSGRNRTVTAGEDTVPAGSIRRHAAIEEPVPRHMRSMLAISRAAATGQGPMPVLQALAETIRSELSFHVVAVNVLDEARGELRCVLVLGSDDARRTLLGTASPWSEWETVMGPEHDRCGAVWLPAGSHEWSDAAPSWVPPAAATSSPDSWDPDDMLLLPLRGAGGDVLGVISVDQPVSGRRPDDTQITYLMAVADHAALALEQSRRQTAPDAVPGQSTELRLAAVMLLAEALDLRDASTARHSRTVGAFAQRTARALGVGEDRLDHIRAAGVLHDLGKLGIADAILHKPGPLDEAEWREMRRHPEIGARILEHAGLHEIAGWVRAHHERVDGGGYPDGIAGAAIPLEARILAVADAYEAMIADRPYRPGMTADAARAELARCAGSQFDAEVVRAFLAELDAEPEAPIPAPVLAATA